MFPEELKRLIFKVITSWEVIVTTVVLVFYFFIVFSVARLHRPVGPKLKLASLEKIKKLKIPKRVKKASAQPELRGGDVDDDLGLVEE
jgi:hypothetical protein